MHGRDRSGGEGAADHGSSDASIAPGKRARTAALQRRTLSPGSTPAAAGPAAAVAGPTAPAADPFWFATGPAIADAGTALPHLAAIQQSFGRHEVGGVEAHVGGDAATAAAGLGAMAYATGDHVAFATPPDLRTAAHEAAHVVQQRAGVSLLGGVDGGDADPLERHADEVAEVVVQGGSSEALLDAHAGRGGVAPPPVLQRRRIVIDPTKTIDTAAISWGELEAMLEDEALSMDIRKEIMRAIDAGEVQGGYPGAEQYARDHLDFMHRFLPRMNEAPNEYSWIRRITGGGRGTLSGKRGAGGAIKTDMSAEEYATCAELSEGFYDTADELNLSRPRQEWLTLYRGYTIPALERPADVEPLLAGFSDTLPSSASWQREKALEMSEPGEVESAILVYMAIPPEHPIVIMSYPGNQRPDHQAPHALDIGQAEVMVAASTYDEIELFRIEQLSGGRVRYHVSVTVVARPREEVMDGIEAARLIASEGGAGGDGKHDDDGMSLVGSRTIDPGALKKEFGDVLGSELLSAPVPTKVYRAVDGKSWKLVDADETFGYIFLPA